MKKTFVLLAVLALAGVPAFAGEGHSCAKHQTAQNAKAGCMAAMEGVERSVSKLDNGVRITVTGKDAEAVKAIQARFTADGDGCANCPMHAEGVTRSVEKTENGVVVTATTGDAGLAKKIQDHAATMTGKPGCCAKGAATGSKGSGCMGTSEQAPAKS